MANEENTYEAMEDLYEKAVPGLMEFSGNPLNGETWFQGRISRETAEILLNEKPQDHECFLVRESIAKQGTYSITLKHKGEIKHFLIKKHPSGGYEVAGAMKAFDGVRALVEFYRMHPLTSSGELLTTPFVWTPITSEVPNPTSTPIHAPRPTPRARKAPRPPSAVLATDIVNTAETTPAHVGAVQQSGGAVPLPAILPEPEIPSPGPGYNFNQTLPDGSGKSRRPPPPDPRRLASLPTIPRQTSPSLSPMPTSPSGQTSPSSGGPRTGNHARRAPPPPRNNNRNSAIFITGPGGEVHQRAHSLPSIGSSV